MWRKNLLFVTALGLAALSAAAGLRPRQQLELLRREPLAVAVAPDDLRHVVDRLDLEFVQHWEQLGLEAAPRADELTITRRLALGLAGTIPSLEEIRLLELLPAEQRTDWWLRRLLAQRRCADYLAERFTRAWVGTDDGPFLLYRRRRFVNWLSDQLLANRPYDELVRELLTSTGLWTNHPAVNFVTATVSDDRPDPIRLAGRTSRALLGMRFDCLQCHDDMLGNIHIVESSELRSGTQRDFHQLAAYFSEVTVSLAGVRDHPQPYVYRFLDKDAEEIVEPAPPFARDRAPLSGNRRSQLAAWVTHAENRPFARAIVNRIWALMFGRPLVEPVDDIPLAGPFPPGLELLADDLAQHHFDLQRLIQIIAASKVFQADSRAEFEITPEHEQHFAVFPLTRLRPEQAARSILQACSLRTASTNSHIFLRFLRFFEQRDFVDRYGDMGEDEFTDRGGTIPQRLLMMNGKLVAERIGDNPFTNASAHLAMFADDRQAIETAYLATLSRRPTPEEVAVLLPRFQEPERSRAEACEDLYWVLLNSSEFLWNH